jgi:preprotein translocase subunit SecF
VAILVFNGVRLGIEFTGGTEVQLRYADRPDVAAVRQTLADAGLPAQVTTIGDPAENEIFIRLAEESGVVDVTGRVTSTLRRASLQTDKLDLNVADPATLTTWLEPLVGQDRVRARELAEAISARRSELAVLRAVGDLGGVSGLTPEIMTALEQRAFAGPFVVRSQSHIGPAVGHELLVKAQWAIGLSLLMMLLYIWFRFEFEWGLAAVLALVHDTLITLGLFSVFDKELSLPVVAAFLTLVGYSVNDTVVIFDRIRENLRTSAAVPLETTINLSVNQTLSRSVITSGLTWISVLALYIFGGPALDAFAFVLCVGIVVGSYSTIYIASPILLLWRGLLRRLRERGSSSTTAERRTKKVRTSS